ncbi:MAG: hypothetical protein KJ015_08905, partial [Myxococcales bacterium]|nr:hypothetical protein [Myxococcales bacterium]
ARSTQHAARSTQHAARSTLVSSDVGLKLGILAAALCLGGWNDGQVGVKTEHISSWGSGTLSSPIVVNRDNPWFEGWYSAPPGRWMFAAGTYSHVYSSSPFAGGHLRTFEFAEPSWNSIDDWQTPIRGDSLHGYGGYQTPDEAGWLKWAMRSGNLVPGGLYAATLAYSGPSGPSTWFKLADDVLVVPVVVIAWRKNYPAAGDPQWQDFRTRAAALFDFIPFQGSRTTNWPADWGESSFWFPEPTMWPWTKFESEDPTAYYDPPDDVWTQCGIQFQVVAAFMFDAPKQFEQYCYAGARHFYDADSERNNLIEGAVGQHGRKLLVTDLSPVFAEFGYLACSNFWGNWVVGSATFEIDRADASPPSNLVAHELGHVLLGSGHSSAPGNLMRPAPANDHGLDAFQCSTARAAARDFAARFWTFNRAIGRISAQNPYAPTYIYGEDPGPVSMEYSCCQNGSEKSWEQAGVCLLGGGDILPDQKCTVCCQIQQSPPDARFRPLGGCPEPDVILEDWCDQVCCEIDAQRQLMSRLKCDNTPEAVEVDKSLCSRRSR